MIEVWEQRFMQYLPGGADLADGAHDLGHFRRVWHMCRRIDSLEGEKGDLLVLLAASYFHDLVSLPKNHPDRPQSSRLSAEKVGVLLRGEFSGFPEEKIGAVQHAIEAHSFSAGITARSYEARVLQDADRMEALGAIGIARTFYVAGLMHSQLFDAEDPLGERRNPNDSRFALDHFQVKLLQLPEKMQTAAGKQIARQKAAILVAFREQIAREVLGEE